MGISKEQQRQNSEAFAACLQFSHSQNVPIQPLDDHFTFDVGKPEKGKRYFAATCNSCGENAPFFEDRTNGAVQNPFKGPFLMTTDCVSCGSAVSVPVGALHSVQWD